MAKKITSLFLCLSLLIVGGLVSPAFATSDDTPPPSHVEQVSDTVTITYYGAPAQTRMPVTFCVRCGEPTMSTQAYETSWLYVGSKPCTNLNHGARGTDSYELKFLITIGNCYSCGFSGEVSSIQIGERETHLS